MKFFFFAKKFRLLSSHPSHFTILTAHPAITNPPQDSTPTTYKHNSLPCDCDEASNTSNPM